MENNLGLSEKAIDKVASILNSLLSDEELLYIKTKNFHWNVTGAHFSEYHVFFDGQAAELAIIIDATAERVRALNVRSLGSMQEFIAASRLKENTSSNIDAKSMLEELLADHESLMRNLRDDIKACEESGDAGNADFLTATLESHEKMAWMLRAYCN